MKNIPTPAFYAKCLFIALLTLLLAGCGSDEPTPPNPTPRTFTVTFNLNAADAQGQPEPQPVQGDSTVARPLNPTRPGYLFAGWFTEEALQNSFNFDTPITGETILYAKWELEAVAGRFLIPDDNFRNKLKSLIPDAFDDWERLITEHEQVTTRTALDVRLSSIADLKGIEYFTALEVLNGHKNQLTALDVSRNTALKALICQDNQLKELDVSRNTALTSLQCGGNDLTSLDVSQNTALTSLQCGGNDLTSLNVSQNTALTSLECGDNDLTSLDVSQNTALTALQCADNALEKLNIRGMRSADGGVTITSATSVPPLDTLKVHENLKDYIHVKDVKDQRREKLTIETYSAEAGSTDYTLVCEDYYPSSQKCGNDASTFTVTFNLNADDAKGEVKDQTLKEGQTANRPQAPTRQGYTFLGWFTDPNVQNAFDFDALITENVILYARWEQRPEKFLIPDEDFRAQLRRLIPEALDDKDSLLTQHQDVKTRTALDLEGISLVIADLTGIEYFTALEELDCSGNRLTSLDMSKNTDLKTLDCSNNQLTNLDMSHNTALTSLSCQENQLTSLNLSQNTALTDLGCGINELTELNVSQNTALTALRCSNNQLTSLDVSHNTALEVLNCPTNKLTSLDVSHNTALEKLDCRDNQLTSLDMRGVRSLSLTLNPLRIAGSNPLTSLKVHENLQDHAEIKEAKTNRGDALVIETYSAEAGSTDYTAVCLDYNPNDGDEGKCLKADSE